MTDAGLVQRLLLQVVTADANTRHNRTKYSQLGELDAAAGGIH